MSNVINPTLDSATLSNRTQEIEPVVNHERYEKREEEDLASAAYYEYFDYATFKASVFQFIVSSNGTTGIVTLTVEATVQNDGTAAASVTEYVDVTNAAFGSASFVSGEGVDDDFLLVDNAEYLACFKYVRLKIVITGSSSDVGYTVHHNRIY